jgi:tetratricopeptide (TPR) repeat protein
MLTAATAQVAEDRASLARAHTAALAAADGRAARRTADAFFGYGQYAEAAELYRAALQKGGEDAGLVNVRLGTALALAGRRTEAETAFRAVTGGDRAELARLWLLWLAQHP